MCCINKIFLILTNYLYILNVKNDYAADYFPWVHIKQCQRAEQYQTSSTTPQASCRGTERMISVHLFYFCCTFSHPWWLLCTLGHQVGTRGQSWKAAAIWEGQRILSPCSKTDTCPKCGQWSHSSDSKNMGRTRKERLGEVWGHPSLSFATKTETLWMH